MKPFPGYFTGSMQFFDAWGNEMCKTGELYFLYQFRNGMFGTRYIQAEVKRPGIIKSFMLKIDQLGWSRSGSIGPDTEADVRTSVVPLWPGGTFWVKNFMFSVEPNTPEEISKFIEEMGIIKVDGRRI